MPALRAWQQVLILGKADKTGGFGTVRPKLTMSMRIAACGRLMGPLRPLGSIAKPQANCLGAGKEFTRGSFVHHADGGLAFGPNFCPGRQRQNLPLQEGRTVRVADASLQLSGQLHGNAHHVVVELAQRRRDDELKHVERQHNEFCAAGRCRPSSGPIASGPTTTDSSWRTTNSSQGSWIDNRPVLSRIKNWFNRGDNANTNTRTERMEPVPMPGRGEVIVEPAGNAPQFYRRLPTSNDRPGHASANAGAAAAGFPVVAAACTHLAERRESTGDRDRADQFPARGPTTGWSLRPRLPKS